MIPSIFFGTECCATYNVYYKNYVIIYAINLTNTYLFLNKLF